MKGKILGWDVGGANIKVACLGDDRECGPAVVEQPFLLWREPQGLSAVLATLAERVGGAGAGSLDGCGTGPDAGPKLDMSSILASLW